MTDPVAGSLQVTAASYPPTDANVMFSNYRLAGVVSGPGVPPTAVEQRGIARVSRWPQAGSVLPVTVDRAQPSQFVIGWDQVPAVADQAMARAQVLALQERTGLDAAVLNQAVERSGQSPARGTLPPPEVIPGTVVAVSPVPVSADGAPAGGTFDLSVRTAAGTFLVRACCASENERARIVVTGAQVKVAPATPDVATLIPDRG